MPNARFKMTEADFIEAKRLARAVSVASYPLASWLGRGVALVVAIAIVLACLRLPGAYGSAARWLLGFMAYSTICGFASVLVYPDLAFGRAYRRYPMAMVPVDIAWDASGIAVNPYGPAPLVWRGLEKWKATATMMVIYTRAHRSSVLPDRAFAEGERALMEEYLRRARVPEARAGWWRRLSDEREAGRKP